MPDAPLESRRAALWRGLLHPHRSQVVVAVLLAVLGFAAVTQVRTNDHDSTYAGYREQDLIDVLNGLAGTTQRAQSEISRLQGTRDSLLSDTAKRKAAQDQAKQEVDNLKILAGLVPVSGPGVRIHISERTSEVKVGDFLNLVEELRSVGAEAIQVNGKVRLVAQSYFEQSADGLVIDGTLLVPPYEVDAIGEPSTLSGAVTFGRGPKDQLESDGASVTIDETNALEIKAVRAEQSSAQ
jgi:uncharacterized protein YlxW (UPF0749 family)